MKTKYSIFFLLFFCITAFAASSPLAMLQSTSDQALAALKQNSATLKTNPRVVYQIMNTIIVPHFDLQGMARAVVSRDVWNQASQEQRVEFTRQFTVLLVRTYSSALASYQNEKVEFLPSRAGANGSRTQINSQIVRQGGPAISVNYRLALVGSTWKIYDFTVEGVSLLESYRTQFAGILSQGGGLAALISKLNQHNA